MKIFGKITLRDNQAIELNNSANSFAVSVRAPSALSANRLIVLPGTAGSSGDSMVTDGSGNLSFAARVQGPGSATDNSLVRFDGTTGSLIQNSNASLSDAGALSLAAGLSLLDSGFSVSLLAPTLAASYSLTLPTDDGTSGQVLTTDGSGVLSWTSPATGLQKVVATWADTDGASKTVTHNLGTTVQVQVYDLTDNSLIMVESVVQTDSNTVDLTASSAPSASGFQVIIIG